MDEKDRKAVSEIAKSHAHFVESTLVPRLNKLERGDDKLSKGFIDVILRLDKLEVYNQETGIKVNDKVLKRLSDLEDRLSKPTSAASSNIRYGPSGGIGPTSEGHVALTPAINNGIIKAKMYAKMKRRVAELEEDNEKLKIQNEKGKRLLKAATKALSLNQLIDFAYENMVNEQRIEFCKDTMSIK